MTETKISPFDNLFTEFIESNCRISQKNFEQIWTYFSDYRVANQYLIAFARKVYHSKIYEGKLHVKYVYVSLLIILVICHGPFINNADELKNLLYFDTTNHLLSKEFNLKEYITSFFKYDGELHDLASMVIWNCITRMLFSKNLNINVGLFFVSVFDEYNEVMQNSSEKLIFFMFMLNTCSVMLPNDLNPYLKYLLRYVENFLGNPIVDNTYKLLQRESRVLGSSFIYNMKHLLRINLIVGSRIPMFYRSDDLLFPLFFQTDNIINFFPNLFHLFSNCLKYGLRSDFIVRSDKLFDMIRDFDTESGEEFFRKYGININRLCPGNIPSSKNILPTELPIYLQPVHVDIRFKQSNSSIKRLSGYNVYNSNSSSIVGKMGYFSLENLKALQSNPAHQVELSFILSGDDRLCSDFISALFASCISGEFIYDINIIFNIYLIPSCRSSSNTISDYIACKDKYYKRFVKDLYSTISHIGPTISDEKVFDQRILNANTHVPLNCNQTNTWLSFPSPNVIFKTSVYNYILFAKNYIVFNIWLVSINVEGDIIDIPMISNVSVSCGDENKIKYELSVKDHFSQTNSTVSTFHTDIFNVSVSPPKSPSDDFLLVVTTGDAEKRYFNVTEVQALQKSNYVLNIDGIYYTKISSFSMRQLSHPTCSYKNMSVRFASFM